MAYDQFRIIYRSDSLHWNNKNPICLDLFQQQDNHRLITYASFSLLHNICFHLGKIIRILSSLALQNRKVKQIILMNKKSLWAIDNSEL